MARAKNSEKTVVGVSGPTTVGKREISPLSKFQRYRKGKTERGLKLLRVWVVDSSAPGFAEEAARQAHLLRGRPEEQEALDFIEAAFAWPDE